MSLVKKHFVKQSMALRAPFKMLILTCFSQATNYCCIGNYERPTVVNTLIFISLAVH